MEKLTARDANGTAIQTTVSNTGRPFHPSEVYEKFTQYQETGLEPYEVVALKEKVKKLCPCDLCIYNPPSSFGGKPCCMCPAKSALLEGSGQDD